MDNLVTEIRSFYSLKEIRESIDEEINEYKVTVDEYGQWLGSLLRDSEATQGKQERLKDLSSLQKSLEKGKKGSTEWIPFKEIMLCASEQGEAEILFEAIEEINKKIERLEKVKNTLEDLEKYGFGKDIIYVAYVHDGIPEKIILRHKIGAEKFKFVADFSISKVP